MGINARRLLLSTCLSAALISSAPFDVRANPEGGSVVAGQATISAAGSQLNIQQQSNKAVIDWRGFDIAPNETTQFHQPDSSAIALNRVNSTSASQIDGTLTANGNVIIVNQNGVLFGRNARVDVNGLVATTADVDNDRFMNESAPHFDKPGNPDAVIVNEGSITAGEAGLVGLVAPTVKNSGVILAKLGRVQLSSGDTTTVDFYGDGLLEVAVSDSASKQLVEHTGSISADGGTIALTAARGKNIVDSLITVHGTLEAKMEAANRGKVLIGGDSATTEIRVAANVDVSGKATGQKGGAIHVTGHHIALMDGAHLDASGDAGGGEILVGGDYQGGRYLGADAAFFHSFYNAQGANGAVPTAARVFVDAGATLDASALTHGNAGRVILWSDNGTAYYGHTDVKGGALSGDGGFIEVSGHDWLGFGGTVNASAANGTAGSLLLDPADITISNAANSAISAATPFQSTGAGSSNLNVTTLQNALNVANVIISSAAGTGGLGDITFVDAVAWNSIRTLTVNASNDIFVNNTITNAGTGSITLNAIVAAAANIHINNSITTGGDITALAKRDVTVAAGATLTTGNAGALSLRAANGSTAGTGNLNLNGDLAVGTGALTLLSGVNGTRPDWTATATNLVPLTGTFGIINFSGFRDLTIDRNLTSSGNISITSVRDLSLTTGHTLTNGAASAMSLQAANGSTAGVGNLNLNGILAPGSGSLTLLSGANGTRPSYVIDTTHFAPQTTVGTVSITGFNDLTINRNLTSLGNMTFTAVRDLTLNAGMTLTASAAGNIVMQAANNAVGGSGNLNWNGIISMGTGTLTTLSGANGTRPSFTLTAANLLMQAATIGSITMQGFQDLTIDRDLTSSGNITLAAMRDLTLSATRTLTTGAAGLLDVRAANGVTTGTGALHLNGNMSVGTGAVTLRSGINGTRPNWTMDAVNFVAQSGTFGVIDIQGFQDLTIGRALTGSSSITMVAVRDLTLNVGSSITTGASGLLSLLAANNLVSNTGILNLNNNVLSVGTSTLTLLSGINGTRPTATFDASNLIRLGATFGAVAITGFQDVTIDRDINSSSNITVNTYRDLTLNAGRTLTTGAAGGLTLQAANTSTAGVGNLNILGNLANGTGGILMRSGANGTRPSWTMDATNFTQLGATVGAVDIRGFQDFTINTNLTSSSNITAVAMRDLTVGAPYTVNTGTAGSLTLQAANGVTTGTGNLNLNGNIGVGTGALTLFSGINGTRPSWSANSTNLNRLGGSFGAINIQGFQDVTIDRDINSSGAVTVYALRDISLLAGRTLSTGAGAFALDLRAANGSTAGTGNLNLAGNLAVGTGAITMRSGINGTRPDWTINSTTLNLLAATVGALDIQGFRDLVVDRDLPSSGAITLVAVRDLTLNAARTITNGAASAMSLQAANGAAAGTGALRLNGNLSVGTGAFTLISGINGTRPSWSANSTNLVRQGATFGAINWQGFANVTIDRPLNSSTTVSFSNNTLTTISDNISGSTLTFGNPTVIDQGVTANLTSTGALTFSSTLNGTAGGASENLNINAGTGTVTFSGIVGGTTPLGNLSVTADNLTISANLAGTGALTLAPATAGRAVNIGTAQADTATTSGFNLSNTEMGRIVNGWGSIVLGSLTSGDTTNSRVSFTDPVTFLSGNDVINAAAISSTDPILLRAARDIVLNQDITTSNATANALTVVAGRNFINNRGATALNTGAGGRWLVYSTDVTGTTGEQSLNNAFNRYSCTYGGSCPALGSGNGLLYSFTPTFIVSVSGQTYTYGDAVITPSGYTILTSGYLNAMDAAEGIITGVGNLATTYVQGNNAGTTYTIVDNGSTFASSLGYGFTFSAPTGTVQTRAITVSALDQIRTYGFGSLGTTGFGISSGSLYGTDAIGGVTLATNASTSTSGHYNYSATPWTLSASAANFSSGLASNYAITYAAAPTGLTVNQRTLTVSATASNKIYDGLATVAFALADDRVLGDLLTTSGTASFSDKNVANGKMVSVAGIGISGTDAANYSYNTSTSTTADITPRTLTITANNQTLTYGAGNSFNGFSSSGLQNGETIGGVTFATDATLSTSGNWNYRAAPWSISASNATGGTFDANNYAISYVNAPVGLTINQRALAITTNGINKIYDGLNNAGVSYADDRVVGDLLTASGTASFSDQNVANGKTVSVSGIGISGTDVGNYTFNTTATTTADITPRALVVSANNVVMNYGAGNSFGGYGISGLQNGETVGSVTLATNATSSTSGNWNYNASPWTISASNATGGTFDAHNYTISYTSGALTVNRITAGLAGFTAADKLYDARRDATLNATGLSGLVAGDTVQVASLSGLFDSNAVGLRTATVTSGSLGGADAGNYLFAIGSGTATATIHESDYVPPIPSTVQVTSQTPMLVSMLMDQWRPERDTEKGGTSLYLIPKTIDCDSETNLEERSVCRGSTI